MAKRGKKKVSIQLWVAPSLREDFKQAALQDQRTVASALRSHMQKTVERAKQKASA